MPNKILAGNLLECYCQTTLSKFFTKCGESDGMNLLYSNFGVGPKCSSKHKNDF